MAFEAPPFPPPKYSSTIAVNEVAATAKPEKGSDLMRNVRDIETRKREQEITGARAKRHGSGCAITACALVSSLLIVGSIFTGICFAISKDSTSSNDNCYLNTTTTHFQYQNGSSCSTMTSTRAYSPTTTKVHVSGSPYYNGGGHGDDDNDEDDGDVEPQTGFGGPVADYVSRRYVAPFLSLSFSSALVSPSALSSSKSAIFPSSYSTPFITQSFSSAVVSPSSQVNSSSIVISPSTQSISSPTIFSSSFSTSSSYSITSAQATTSTTTAPSVTSAVKSHHGLSGGQIAGIVIGVLVAVLILLAGLSLLLNKSLRNRFKKLFGIPGKIGKSKQNGSWLIAESSGNNDNSNRPSVAETASRYSTENSANNGPIMIEDPYYATNNISIPPSVDLSSPLPLPPIDLERGDSSRNVWSI